MSTSLCFAIGKKLIHHPKILFVPFSVFLFIINYPFLSDLHYSLYNIAIDPLFLILLEYFQYLLPDSLVILAIVLYLESKVALPTSSLFLNDVTVPPCFQSLNGSMRWVYITTQNSVLE